MFGQLPYLASLGLPVPGRAVTTILPDQVFTHFEEEDPGTGHGKLDEELSRMAALAGGLRPGAVVLFNESFASANEREGAQLARQIVAALLDSGVRVLFVTHLYDLAEGFRRDRPGEVLFLRPERLDDGRRTFRLLPGDPQPTSYGPDLYRRIFARPAGHARPAGDTVPAGDGPK